MKNKKSLVGIMALTVSLLLAGCANQNAQDNAGKKTESSDSGVKKVSVIAYDAFALSDDLKAQFEKDSGFSLELLKGGDGVEMTNKLILTKDAPQADVAVGMDNNVLSPALEANVFADSNAKIVDGAKELLFASSKQLVPIDHSLVALNYDKNYFKNKSLPVPTSFEDLTKPEYKNLLVVTDPRKSTPGLAFLYATISHFGPDKWVQYWKELENNGVKVASGWSEAFAGDFTGGENAGGNASYPIMVSYASSPAYAVNEEGSESSLGVIEETTYRQIEYAAMLNGAKNPQGAKSFLEFIQTPAVQSGLSEANYVYPANKEAKMPENLEKFGFAGKNAQVKDLAVGDNRETYLRTWSEAIGQ